MNRQEGHPIHQFRMCRANRLPEIVQGIAFKDGIKQLQAAD